MTELTELPETWYVKVTEENKDILSKWRFGKDSLLKLDTYHITGMCFSHYNKKLEKGHNPVENTEEFGKEITFEQFKKWVLKENVQYEHEVVHCTTQEEWDFVIDTLGFEQIRKKDFKIYGNNKSYCKNIKRDSYSQNLNFYKNKNFLILSFQEWCDKFNHVNPLNEKIETWSVGTYVVIIGEYHSVNIGEVHKINDVTDGLELSVDISESVGVACLPPKSGVKWFATLKEAEEFSKTLSRPKVFISNNDLLEEAKRRYPVGTNFISAYDKKSKYQVDENFYSFWDLSNIVVNTKNGPSIYNNGVWAEIISTPLESNITNGLSNFRVSHDFNKPIKSNNVLLLDTIIQPIKIETISDKLTFKKETKILTIK